MSLTGLEQGVQSHDPAPVPPPRSGRHILSIRLRRQVVVVEGNFDVISLHQHGFDKTVAPMGTALTETQVLEAGLRVVQALEISPEACIASTLLGGDLAAEGIPV